MIRLLLFISDLVKGEVVIHGFILVWNLKTVIVPLQLAFNSVETPSASSWANLRTYLGHLGPRSHRNSHWDCCQQKKAAFYGVLIHSIQSAVPLELFNRSRRCRWNRRDDFNLEHQEEALSPI
jgi:hypothetical protein